MYFDAFQVRRLFSSNLFQKFLPFPLLHLFHLRWHYILDIGCHCKAPCKAAPLHLLHSIAIALRYLKIEDAFEEALRKSASKMQCHLRSPHSLGIFAGTGIGDASATDAINAKAEKKTNIYAGRSYPFKGKNLIQRKSHKRKWQVIQLQQLQ